jgi:hypothetical protein
MPCFNGSVCCKYSVAPYRFEGLGMSDAVVYLLMKELKPQQRRVPLVHVIPMKLRISEGVKVSYATNP